MGRLSGRIALVTGSTGGIGATIAERLAADGAHVLVSGRRRDLGEKVVAGIAERGGRADFLQADLATSDGVTALAEAALARAGERGRIDILVNNAAALVGGRATVETPESLIDTVLDTNIKAPFLLTAALVPAMIEAGSGSVINVGSVNGLTGMSGAALYGASKAALHAMTQAWAAEWARQGVRVNTVAPGPTATEFIASIAEHLDGLVGRVPTGRMSEPAEVAAVVSFLASDEAAHIHGATIPVDGGLTATFPI
jgi:NAD(P)-dependent dehydrogenase (short-subunit alcohol dehydrogenase family)